MRAIAAKGDKPMSELPMEFELNQNRPIDPNHLQNALAEVEVYSEEWSGDEPQEEVVA